MKNLLLGLAVVGVLGAALAFSGNQPPNRGLQFTLEQRNPVTNLNINLDDPDDGFQFAIVSDRTGGHRANVFSQAVERLNLLQPAFVISVGDLIEGGNKKPEVLDASWKEFDGFVGKLTMPFFYAAGNHDANAKAAAKFWKEKMGRTYYHFVYRKVLFLILNSEDPPASDGNIDKAQLAYAEKTLGDNRDVRWTIVVVHRPMWASPKIATNGWGQVEAALKDRRYTVFAGHLHNYKKYVRNGQNYYQLATTGGSSLMRGVERGEFDQIAWVTMKKDGPILANILIESVLAENLVRPITNEPVESKAKPTFKVNGRAYFEGSPIPGAEVLLQPAKGKGLKAVGIVAADGSFQVSTYTANDGAVEGEYNVAVTWKQTIAGKKGVNVLPERYAATLTSELGAVIGPGRNDILLELKK